MEDRPLDPPTPPIGPAGQSLDPPTPPIGPVGQSLVPPTRPIEQSGQQYEPRLRDRRVAAAGEQPPDPTPVDSSRPDGETDEPPSGGAARGRRQVTRFRWRQRVARGVGLLVVLGVAYFGISLFQVWSAGRTDDRDPVDAIVVMGAAQFDGRPSPQLAGRLDHVLEIWPDDVAPLVVTTGGNLPGDRFTEAESSRNYLVDGGIPDDAILLEDEGGTTYESLESVAEILAERDLDEVVIVTDPYHALRSKLIAESVGLQASVSSTTTSVVTGSASLRRHLVEGGGVAIGRIIGFERLDAWTN